MQRVTANPPICFLVTDFTDHTDEKQSVVDT